MNDIANTLGQIARDGARGHQLRFARERLETLRWKLRDADARALDLEGIREPLFTDWLADLDYAIAQIKAAEGPPTSWHAHDCPALDGKPCQCRAGSGQ